MAEYLNTHLAGLALVPKQKLEVIPQKCLSQELFRPQNCGRLCVIDPLSETNRCISCGI